MRVLLISDYSLEHSSGGAQRSNDLLMQKGRDLGHVISEFNYDQNYSNRLMQDANQDTHTEVAVPVTNYVSRWMTHKEAEKFMESDEE